VVARKNWLGIWKSNGRHSAAYCQALTHLHHPRFSVFPACSALLQARFPAGEFHQFDALADLAAIPDEIISLSIRIDPLNFHPALTINACN
jgi:hypothetical protein